MRSRSAAMRMAPTTARRSCAIGWRLAISVMARSSSSRCLASMMASSEIDALRQRIVGCQQRLVDAGTIALGEIAHVADQPVDVLEILVEGRNRMFDRLASLVQSCRAVRGS